METRGLRPQAIVDYHLQPEKFFAWLDVLDAERVRLFNPVPVVRWNADKSYLLELAERGVPVVPSVRFPRGARVRLEAVLEERGWQAVVLKPAISASAHDAWLVERKAAASSQSVLERLLSAGAVLAQPFVEAVRSRGEWSLVFLDGAFSHAIVKRPAAGDFRVQEEHGGRVEVAAPAPALVAQAARVLEAARSATGESAALLYSRVDGIWYEDAFTLMELELIEPCLYFREAADAAPRLANALLARLGARSE